MYSSLKQLVTAFLMSLMLMVHSVDAQVIDDFSSKPQMHIYKAVQRGCSFEIQASTDNRHKLLAGFLWQDTHAGFLEYYYAKDPAIPNTTHSASGVGIVKMSSGNPEAIKGLALRIKDASGEILHYQQTVELSTHVGLDVVFPIETTSPQGHWGGNNDGKLDLPLKLTGYAWIIDKQAKAGNVIIEQVSWQATQSQGKPTPKAVAHKPSKMDSYPLEQAHLFEPLWQGAIQYDEHVALIKEPDSDRAYGTLLFAPGKIIGVTSCDTMTVFEQGRDFTIDATARRIVLTADSRIPSITREELYRKPNEKRAIRSKLGDPDKWLLYAETWFPNIQVKVTYEHADAWLGYTPQYAGSQLPRVTGLIQSGKPVSICLIGDSITSGANATSRGYKPHMPPYGILVQRAIEAQTGSKVTLNNLAVSGTTSDGAMNVLPRIGESKPDLFVIAYGMNDVAGRNPRKFGENISGLLTALKQSYPEAEYVLVSSSMANPQWTWSREDMFEPYRQQLVSLQAQHDSGCALADVTALWADLLKTKRYYDLTGNGINHPNDFGHRLYAQTLLALLIAH